MLQEQQRDFEHNPAISTGVEIFGALATTLIFLE